MLSPKTSFTVGDKEQRGVKIKSITHVTDCFKGPICIEFVAKLACSVSKHPLSEILVAVMKTQSRCKFKARMQSHPL